MRRGVIMTTDEDYPLCEHCGRPYGEECNCDESKIDKLIRDILEDDGPFFRQPPEGEL
jgi:hypothetical protein